MTFVSISARKYFQEKSSVTPTPISNKVLGHLNMNNNDNKENSEDDKRKTIPGVKSQNIVDPGYISKQEIDELEAQIVKHEKVESKKPKTSNKLPGELAKSGPSCEADNVGDDVNKKSEQDILCECHPNVTGAAIPQMISFNSLPSTSRKLSDGSVEKSRIAGNQQDDSEDEDESNKVIKSHAKMNLIPSLYGFRETSPESIHSNVGVATSVEDEEVSTCDLDKSYHKSRIVKNKISPSTSKTPGNTKPTKKPSLIPKFTRANSSTKPVRDCGKLDLLVTPVKAIQLTSPKKIDGRSASKRVVIEDNKTSTPGTIKMSSRMIDLQERLKATTSLLRRKFEDDKKKDCKSMKKVSDDVLAREDSNLSKESSDSSVTNMLEGLLTNISQMRQTVLKVQTSTTQKIQKEYVQKLFLKISEIQKIADKLSELEMNPEVPDCVKSEKATVPQKAPTNKNSTKNENKIYIKFMQTKDKNKEMKNKLEDPQTDNTEGVQTDLALGSKLTSESLNSESDEKKHQKENTLKESDSMDGVFIPSCEPPMNTEEEDESNGLDITITFPEFTNTLSNRPESHLSVRLSDISAEALRQLKRCPKDFTLRMDFVQGKVLFQSGKAPVNNFSIGPDLKFVENLVVDNKKSDIISIKPSTECSFASQLISVENVNKELGSGRSLRATDSEIFSVVNMPFMYRNPSSVTKSCVTFKNDGIFSMIFAGQFFRSMPQIPCLPNIFEDGFIENVNKAAASREKKKKPTQSKEGDCAKH